MLEGATEETTAEVQDAPLMTWSWSDANVNLCTPAHFFCKRWTFLNTFELQKHFAFTEQVYHLFYLKLAFSSNRIIAYYSILILCCYILNRNIF